MSLSYFRRFSLFGIGSSLDLSSFRPPVPVWATSLLLTIYVHQKMDVVKCMEATHKSICTSKFGVLSFSHGTEPDIQRNARPSRLLCGTVCGTL